MKSNTWQDKNNWTHIDWELDGVTPRMLNWFWSNMEKCDNLWHPNQHMDFGWFVSIKQAGGPIGAIHIAPQKWDNNKFLNIYIRWDHPRDLTPEMREVIQFDHLVLCSGISLTGENVHPDDPTFGYRIHQWQKTDSGVVGKSTAIEVGSPNDADNGLIWAKHATEEIGNWEVFLPRLYELYRVIENPHICPYYSFRIEKRDGEIEYLDF